VSEFVQKPGSWNLFKEGKNGNKFFSGTVREPYRKPEETPPPPPLDTDDAPF